MRQVNSAFGQHKAHYASVLQHVFYEPVITDELLMR